MIDMQSSVTPSIYNLIHASIHPFILPPWYVSPAGRSAEAAADEALAYMKERVGGLGGVVVVDPQGEWSARFSSLQMAWAAAQQQTLHYGLYAGEHFTQNIDDPY